MKPLYIFHNVKKHEFFSAEEAEHISKEASIENFNLLLNIQWILQRMDILAME